MLKFTFQEGWSSGQQKPQSQHRGEADKSHVGDDADHTKLCQADQQHKATHKHDSRHFDVTP